MNSSLPSWFAKAMQARQIDDKNITVGAKAYVFQDGIWSTSAVDYSAEQAQSCDIFGFKWQRRDTFESPKSLARNKQWSFERYGNPRSVLDRFANTPILLDAGCGAAMSTLEYWGESLKNIHYIGVDISEAVQVAKSRMSAHEPVFIRDDITALPFPHQSVDIIYSSGVLHHTDNTRNAMASLVPFLREGGCFIFYVYRKKGPIREFVDDCLREKLAALSPEKGWQALKPLTDLGMQLGKIDAEIHFPEGFPLLDIPPGSMPLQRFFYWHVAKAFYHEDLTFDEMHHINFDWYAPQNAHRQTPEEVSSWCEELGLNIERMHVEEAGISVVACRKI
ncbi:class I SAM-dependent methyltransferase [Desulfovibrio sp. OttesenSCG-928-G11]|nr:class I SAM-dependent methyltransferase [Desulfovibrio sp. OttesenSCG-928-G11]